MFATSVVQRPTMEAETQPKPEKMAESADALRRTVAIVVVLATCTYIIAVLLGRIPTQQKLNAADISVIVVAAGVVSILLRPQLLDRLTHLKFGGLELDWLEKLQQDQQKQRDELDDVRFVLTLLLQPSELENLRQAHLGLERFCRADRAGQTLPRAAWRVQGEEAVAENSVLPESLSGSPA